VTVSTINQRRLCEAHIFVKEPPAAGIKFTYGGMQYGVLVELDQARTLDEQADETLVTLIGKMQTTIAQLDEQTPEERVALSKLAVWGDEAERDAPERNRIYEAVNARLAAKKAA
jgi:hypothetical protein